jgi:hypothetical protein
MGQYKIYVIQQGKKKKISPTTIKNYIGTSRGMEGSIDGT